jgi:hypothetical protein
MSIKEVTGPLSAAVKRNPAPTERMFGNLPGKKAAKRTRVAAKTSKVVEVPLKLFDRQDLRDITAVNAWRDATPSTIEYWEKNPHHAPKLPKGAKN